jgi:hypothetical protein
MTALAQEIFDPSAYPRTYGLSVAGKCLVSVGGLVLAALGLGVLYLSSSGGGGGSGSLLVMLICGVFSLAGFYLLAVAVFYRITLQFDSIEVFEIYRRRQLQRGDIEGRSHQAYGYSMSAWVLVPKPGFGGKIKLSTLLKTDKDYLSWIRSLPDLDLKKQKEAEQERREAVAALHARGITEATLRRAATVLNWSTYGFGFAGFFLSSVPPVLTWLLILLPWVAIFLVAKFTPFYRFGGPRNGPLPDLTMALIGPGFFLMLSSLQHVAPVAWEAALSLAVLGSVLLTGAAFWSDPYLKTRLGLSALLLALGCSYGYGAGMQVNVLLDRSAPQTFAVAVQSKRVNHGKSTTYHLQLAPWGPHADGQDILVSSNFYARTKSGDRICMELRPGALNVAWSQVRECGGDSMPLSFVNGFGRGYSIKLESVSPAPGTPVSVGQTVDVKVKVSYDLSVADMGVIFLVVEDETDKSLLGDRRLPSQPAPKGHGTLTLIDSFVVPAGSHELRLYVPLVPQGMTHTSGELELRYPITDSRVPN